jgi:hypothetical protein
MACGAFEVAMMVFDMGAPNHDQKKWREAYQTFLLALPSA